MLGESKLGHFRWPLLFLTSLIASCGGHEREGPSGQGGIASEGNSAAGRQAEFTAAAETVVIGTRDGKKVYGVHVPVSGAQTIIVLFHQEDSSAAEYREAIHRLNMLGYSTLAVDLRSGGNRYGPNRTVTERGGSTDDYLSVLPDLEAALNWARLQNRHVILWGTRFSASLAFRVAADNPDRIMALLAFSPGEYFPDTHYTRRAANQVHAPALITCSGSAEEVAQAQEIFDSLPAPEKALFLPKQGGTQDASAERKSSSGADEEASWTVIKSFLAKLNAQSRQKT